MAYDTVTTAAVAAELRERLPRGRVDKVIQPSAYAVALLVRAAGANHTLLLSAHPQQARVTLTAERLAKAFAEPSPFVMLLRKHLEGATLASVQQSGYDRILRLSFQPHMGPHASHASHVPPVLLIAEVMGKHSNIILVDEQDTILGAVKRITPALSRYRVVLPRHPYILPPAQTQPAPHEGEPRLDPLAVSPEALAAALADLPAEMGLAPALLSLLEGMSPQLTREVAYRVAGDASAPLAAIRGDAAPDRSRALLDTLRELMAPSAWQPSIARRDGTVLGWAAYPLRQHGVEPDLYPSISGVLDEVYGGVESGDALGSTRAELRAIVEGHRARLDRKIASLRVGLRPREEIDALRRQGEMVLAFAHEIAPGQSELRLDDPPLTVPLDPTLTPPENARALFARYRKARDAQDKVPVLLDEAEDGLRFLDAALLFVEQADSPQALREIRDDVRAAGFSLPGDKATTHAQTAAKREKPRGKKGGAYHPGGKEAPKKGGVAPALRFTTRDGLEVLVGRSARQNEVVTFHLATGGDLWFHARGLPGSHVVLKTAGRTPTEVGVEEAAALAAYYSRGRGSTTVPVDVVPARNVRRVKGGKPGLVHISGETTINVRPRPDLEQ